MSWYRFKITISEAGPAGYLAAVQPFVFDIERAILKAGNPGNLGLFASPPADREQYFYLPPNSSRYCQHLLDKYSAGEVEKPAPTDLREIADDQTKNAFGYWFPEFEPKPPNLLFRTYRHVPISDLADE